jgi:hypothetical protein
MRRPGTRKRLKLGLQHRLALYKFISHLSLPHFIIGTFSPHAIEFMYSFAVLDWKPLNYFDYKSFEYTVSFKAVNS